MVLLTRQLHPVVVATGSVTVAAAVRLLLGPLLGPDAPLLIFVLAVVVSALYGGERAGLLATALSVVVGSTVFIVPGWSLGTASTSDLTRIAVFVIEGVLVSRLVARIEAQHEQLLRANADAERARQDAETANAAKDAFLAVSSHELRTPLNVILGYARMLRLNQTIAPERVQQLAGIIERNAVLKTRLVEDLLDVKRMERGELSLERHPFDMAPVVASVVESLNESARTKRLHVEAHVPSISMEGDAARIQQVIWNLLSNAVKFTPEEGRCRICATVEGENVVVRVENSGDPIPAAFLPRIFQPFQQADMSATRRHSGVGLGLWIVKHLVELHGGDVRVESSSDGTTFTVVLPRMQASHLESMPSLSLHVH